jgi:glucose-6-phosphate 1-dehydrogenase
MEKIRKNGTFVIFGATGDLAARKLIPAFFSLYKKKLLPEGFAADCIGRRGYDSVTFRGRLGSDFKDTKAWGSFSSMIHYIKMDFTKKPDYEILKSRIREIEKTHGSGGNRIYYLAVAPEFFSMITRHLHCKNMLGDGASKHKVMVEKPFGSNLEDAMGLNEGMARILDESDIYRVDHYLGKEMIQNILSLRFGNTIFEPLWNRRHIEGIQIISTETLGVGGRGGYYDKAGVVKDMLQNHMLQMLALTAMEPPSGFSGEEIREAKAEVLGKIDLFNPADPSGDVVTGQYGPGKADGKEVAGFREEENIPPDSTTPTFIAVKAAIGNKRWKGVPFYLLTGKRLAVKETKIAVFFKKTEAMSDFFPGKNLNPNVLVIKIQPEEGVFFRINAKKPGGDNEISPVTMNYCHGCEVEGNSPEAYERITAAAMEGNPSLFTRWDELLNSWEFTDHVEKIISSNRQDYPNYAAGGKGPERARLMTEGCDGGWCFGKEIENEDI